MMKEEDLKEEKNGTEMQLKKGWKEAFQEMASIGDDILLSNDVICHSWDEEEWKW